MNYEPRRPDGDWLDYPGLAPGVVTWDCEGHGRTGPSVLPASVYTRLRYASCWQGTGEASVNYSDRGEAMAALARAMSDLRVVAEGARGE